MRVVLQRVSEASVRINGNISGAIKNGFLVFLGITHEDNEDDTMWLVKKILSIRVFSDENNLMNLNIEQTQGSILLISQFTLHALTKKGNRPSFINSAKPIQAIPLYENFIKKIRDKGFEVETGVFGADMKVSLVNDGPVTIILDSKQRE